MKPSQTTTSAAPTSRSRLSVFPPKLRLSSVGQKRVRLERQLVALLRLLADRKQANLGIAHLEHVLGEDGAHVRELEQVLGPRIGVRARVQQHRGPALGRDHDGDRRARDSRQATQLQEAGRQHRAGVPGGQDRIGLAFAHGAAGGDEGAVRLATHGLGRLLVHPDHLRRLDELQAPRVEARRAEEDRLDRR